MKSIRKMFAVSAISAASVAALLGAPELVRFGGNQAFAEDAQQGKVEKPQVSEQEQRQLNDLSSIFRKVGKSIEPAVVNITVRKSIKASRPQGYDDMLRRFFPDRDGDGEPDLPEGFNDGGGGEGPGGGEQFGTGSGVIMEVQGSDAYILTNNHVAGGATEILVTLFDGRRIEGATVIGTDKKSDMAVVKMKADRVVAAPWGDSDKLEKGDWIMAFGSPFGYVGSMTHGIVSALNRRAGILGQDGYENFIQVDAPINPGNSGGPLVNTAGEVVGINTAIASRNGGFQGVGFSVPSNQAKQIYNALKSNGRVVRGYIGVSIQDVAIDPDLAGSFGYTNRDGVLVRQTFKNTPATDKLHPGDIITGLAGKAVKDSQELRNTIAATPPGTDLKVSVFRKGKTQDVTLKIEEQPEDLTNALLGGGPRPGGDPAAKADANTGNVLGMKLVTPSDQLAEEYALGEVRQGALVTEVDPKSQAAKAGVLKGDVITQVFDEPVLTAKQAADAIAKLGADKQIRLYVVNSTQSPRFVLIKPAGK